MKFSYLLLSVMILSLASCGRDQSSPEKVSEDLPVQELFLKEGIFFGQGSFGELQLGERKLLSFKLTNVGDEVLTGPPSIDQNFAISYQNGCNQIQPNQSCLIKVSFISEGKVGGQSYTGVLNLDNVFINLTASVAAPPSAISSGSVSYNVNNSGVSSLDFGTINYKQNVSKSIMIKNLSGEMLNSQVSLNNSIFQILSDACSGKALKKNDECVVKLGLSGSDKAGSQSANLSFAGSNLSLAASVIAPEGVMGEGIINLSSNLSFIYKNSSTTNLDAGNLTANKAKQVILYLTNEGLGRTVALNPSVDNNNFSIIYNQCNDKKLETKQSCVIRLVYSSQGKVPGEYASVFTVGAKSLPMKFKVVEDEGELPVEEISLLLHFNSSPVFDSSPYSRIVSMVQTAFVSNDSPKFGNGSLAFTNTDGNSFASVNYNKAELLGDGDFTVETFFYPTAGGSNWGSRIISAGTGSDASPGFLIQMVGNSPKILVADGSGTYNHGWKYLNQGSLNVSLNAWHHLAFVKHGNNLLFFVDGQLSFSGDFTGTNLDFSSLRIGAYESINSQGFDGKIDEVRISKKAQYTQSFSVPSEEFIGLVEPSSQVNSSLYTTFGFWGYYGGNQYSYENGSGRIIQRSNSSLIKSIGISLSGATNPQNGLEWIPTSVLVEGGMTPASFSVIERFYPTRNQFFNKTTKHLIFSQVQNYNYYKVTFESYDELAGLSMLLNGELTLWSE